MPKKVKVHSKNEEPKVEAETTEESSEHEEQTEESHVVENTSCEPAIQEVATSDSAASDKHKEPYGPLLKSILTGETVYPPVSPEKTKTKKEECPLLLAALSAPSKLPTTPPRVASPLSSPTKAMMSLQLSSPAKATTTVSAQSPKEQEQEQSSYSRSRARSFVAYESPYNTRSKTKRVRDKEQRSASEDSTKRTGKD